MTRPATFAGPGARPASPAHGLALISPPWRTPVKRMVGPLPFLTTAMGTCSVPQPDHIGMRREIAELYRSFEIDGRLTLETVARANLHKLRFL
jgi:hypothetical protein